MQFLDQKKRIFGCYKHFSGAKIDFLPFLKWQKMCFCTFKIALFSNFRAHCVSRQYHGNMACISQLFRERDIKKFYLAEICCTSQCSDIVIICGIGVEHWGRTLGWNIHPSSSNLLHLSFYCVSVSGLLMFKFVFLCVY